MKTIRERLLKMTAIDRKPGACWLWTGYLDRQGYGRINIGGTPKLAHRVWWQHTFGTEPAELDHFICQNRACVNPLHLEPVTHAENMRRARRVTCKNGHVKGPDNLYGRECLKCMRERARRNSAARRKTNREAGTA